MTEPTFYITWCPDCRGRTQFSEVHAGAQIGTHGYWHWVAVECAVCKMLLTGRSDGEAEIHITTYGHAVKGKEYPDVPSHIGEAASEAYKSMESDCYRGAVILARAVIEATAKDKGITNGNLGPKIEQLEKQGFIRPYVREGADEVRYFGNDMAHGDFVEEVGQTEVQLALELMDEVLTEVYEGPARVEKARARKRALSDKEQPKSSDDPVVVTGTEPTGPA